MPTSPIIIIGGSGGGGNRATAVNYGIGYPVVAGDSIENTATSGGNVYCVFVNNAMYTSDIYLGPDEKYDFTEAGAVTVP